MNNKPTQTIAPWLSQTAGVSGHSTLGTTPQALIDASVPTDVGVYVKASPGNTGVVYVLGGGSDTAGFPLAKTDPAIWCPISNVNLLKARADTSGDTIYYFAF